MKGTEEHSGQKKNYLQTGLDIMAFDICTVAIQLYSAFNNMLFHWYNIRAAGI